MNNITRIILGILDLILGSPIDFPLMLLGGEYLPHWPTVWESDTDSEGKPQSRYHHAKGFWSSLYRTDGEWWSKFTRFVIFWLIIGVII